MFERRIFSKQNFLQLLQNSDGSELFRNYYQENSDILRAWDLSCAFFVSSILVLSGYIERISFTVDGLESQLQEHGSLFVKKSASEIESWDILVWWVSELHNKHSHIGFALDAKRAVSNSSSLGKIAHHSIDYDGTRPVLHAYSILFKN